MSKKKIVPNKKTLEERILDIIGSGPTGSTCTTGDLYNRLCVKGRSEHLYTSEELTQAICSLLSEAKIQDFGEGFFGLPRPISSPETDLFTQSSANY